MPYTLSDTHSPTKLRDEFDKDFATAAPLDHIHGAVLALCNVGFTTAAGRAALGNNLVINLTTLRTSYSNIETMFRNVLVGDGVRFRPDTPIHANDEDRYPGGAVSNRLGERPRHFEFSGISGGMRIVYDLDTEEIYVSAHYSFPGRLTANAGSPELDWLETVQRRLSMECNLMADHASGETLKQRDELTRLRGLVAQSEAKGLTQAARDGTRKCARLEHSLHFRATTNKAFSAWLRDPKANMSKESIAHLYGIGDA